METLEVLGQWVLHSQVSWLFLLRPTIPSSSC